MTMTMTVTLLVTDCTSHCQRAELRKMPISSHACCRYLRDHARGIAGKSQLFINAYAKALEIIPRQLCDNAGFDATDVLNNLRQKHALRSGEGQNYGVDVNTGGVLAAGGCLPMQTLSTHRLPLQACAAISCPDRCGSVMLPAPAESS